MCLLKFFIHDNLVVVVSDDKEVERIFLEGKMQILITHMGDEHHSIFITSNYVCEFNGNIFFIA
jgi:hypothetical protein